jgi:hypothetical protein
VTAEEYLLVEARIRKEKEKLVNLEKELKEYGLWPKITATMIGGFSLDDSAAVRIIGSILHDYYSAAESIFKAVAVNIDKSTRKGDQWHKELLEQMTLNVPGLRVPVISTDTAQKLNHYRSFRHVFRNVYGFELSFNRIKELLELLPDTSVSIKKDLDNFICQMRTIYEVNK